MTVNVHILNIFEKRRANEDNEFAEDLGQDFSDKHRAA